MKLIFAGTPEFSLPTLHALLNSKHEICAVYTRPDKPRGRGQHLGISPIKEAALLAELPVIQPVSLQDPFAQEQMKIFKADALIDVACGFLLPKEVLQIPRFGCINIHPSLLPRWRGAAPIQHAILAGDTKTGVTIMQMDDGWDTGNILKQKEMEIESHDTTGALEEKLAKLGANLLLEVLNDLEHGKINPQKQDDVLSCYAKKIEKEDALIDWNKSAIEIDRMIRAFNPRPIAYTKLAGQAIRIFQAVLISEHPIPKTVPGSIFQINKDSVDIVTGSGIIRLLEVQFPGGKVLSMNEILKSKKELFIDVMQNSQAITRRTRP